MPLRTRLCRTAAALGLSALLLSSPASSTSARADDLPALNPFSNLLAQGSVEGGIARFLLPYSPAIFDVVVTLARSVVVLTYDGRAYDPLTQTFVLRGLRIARGDFEASVDRVRIGASTSVYQGLSIDTRRLTLEPELRDALKRVGSEVIEGDIAVSVDQDAPSASYAVDVSADLRRIGRIDFAASVAGFHLLVPLDGTGTDIDGDGDVDALPNATGGGEPQVVGELLGASLSFRDAGLADAAFAFAKEAQNLSKDEIQGIVAATIGPVMQGLFQDLPGGASPDLQRRSTEWSQTLQAFLAEPDHLEIRFSPERPVALAELQKGAVTSALVEALNPTVSLVPTRAPELIDPAAPAGDDDGIAMSRRLVEGLGVPQDIPAGVRLALGDAVLGDEAAIDIAVSGIVLDPEAAIGSEDATDPYALLLLAKARGVAVPERVLQAFADRLPAETLASGEDKALSQWEKLDTGKAAAEALDAAIAAQDWSAIRQAAFDHYEGDRAPRNLTEAYALAQVAAAGGDRIAAGLRDQLRNGNTETRVLFPAATARAKADALWRRVIAANGAGEGQEEREPAQP
ncbi:hypothetical protein ASG43_16320 [Aureimonas sp. Leaf454]|nr:hypothetical protein ASG43_16320 [Aureimonas sp. Leaf454]